MPKKPSNVIELEAKGYKIFFNPDSHRFWRLEGDKKISISSVTSFTGIIDKSPQLIPWAISLMVDHLHAKVLLKEPITEVDIFDGSKLHIVRKEEAADIGTLAHAWVSSWLKGEDPDLPTDPAVQRVVTSFLEYQDEHQIHWKVSEQPIYYNDGDIEYAGILDAIGEDKDGKLFLADFKSSNSIYNEYAFQAAAYQLAWEWMNNVNIDHRKILRFAKETEDQYLMRMEEKNRKRRAEGKTPIEYAKWVPFEVRELTENMADKLAFKACVTLKNRIKELDHGE